MQNQQLNYNPNTTDEELQKVTDDIIKIMPDLIKKYQTIKILHDEMAEKLPILKTRELELQQINNEKIKLNSNQIHESDYKKTVKFMCCFKKTKFNQIRYNIDINRANSKIDLINTSCDQSRELFLHSLKDCIKIEEKILNAETELQISQKKFTHLSKKLNSIKDTLHSNTNEQQNKYIDSTQKIATITEEGTEQLLIKLDNNCCQQTILKNLNKLIYSVDNQFNSNTPTIIFYDNKSDYHTNKMRIGTMLTELTEKYMKNDKISTHESIDKTLISFPNSDNSRLQILKKFDWIDRLATENSTPVIPTQSEAISETASKNVRNQWKSFDKNHQPTMVLHLATANWRQDSESSSTAEIQSGLDKKEEIIDPLYKQHIQSITSTNFEECKEKLMGED